MFYFDLFCLFKLSQFSVNTKRCYLKGGGLEHWEQLDVLDRNPFQAQTLCEIWMRIHKPAIPLRLSSVLEITASICSQMTFGFVANCTMLRLRARLWCSQTGLRLCATQGSYSPGDPVVISNNFSVSGLLPEHSYAWISLLSFLL